jgi:sigma-B regulation protein RsbU (phosphoserine phosphatase)
VRAGLRAHAGEACAVEEVVARTNRDMCRDTLPNEFTTLWYASVDPRTRVLTYCSAGHEPPFVIRPVPGEPLTIDHVIPLKIGGLVIGVNDGETYESETFQLEAGDVLVAYTDGLPDARNFQNEKWGMGRLVEAAVEAVVALPDQRAGVLLDQILWFLRRFTGLHHQVDDETLIVVRVGEDA